MEYNLCRKTAATAGRLLDTVSEEPVDAELTLPDYCPDIERILQCSLIPKLYAANLSGDRLNVDGGACIRVMYLDGDKGCIRTFEHTVPFSRDFSLKDSPEHCAVYTDAKPEYINCRALRPRKLSLHGAFSLYARILCEQPLEYCTYEDDDLDIRTAEYPISALSGLCHEAFSLQEEVPMNGKPSVASLLGHRLTTRVTEVRAIHNKLMISAEGRLEVMYLSNEKDSAECMAYSFPISHIADCEGVEDGDVIDARLDVLTYDLSHSDDALGGSSVLSIDMKLCFNALCWRSETIRLTEDAFSTSIEVQPQLSPLTFCTRRQRLSFTDIAKESIHIDAEPFARVLDVHCDRIQVSAAVSGGAPLLSSKAELSVLYENAEGEIKQLSRSVDFSFNPSVEDCDSVEGAVACIDSLSYRIIDEHTLELRAEIGYEMTVCRNVSCMAVTAVTADDDAPRREQNSTLILYYAGEGEQVWDIAKRFASRPAQIMQENELESERLDGDVMLLIPTV